MRGKHGDPAAARRRLGAIGTAYLAFASEESGLFATAFALPQQHDYSASEGASGPELTPLGHLRAALDELVDAGVLQRRRREASNTPSGPRCTDWQSSCKAPLRDLPGVTRDHLKRLTGAFIAQALA